FDFKSVRHRYIPHHTGYGSYSYPDVVGLRYGVDKERSSDKAVRSSYRARQINLSRYVFPVLCDGKLLPIGRVVGHYRIVRAVMNHQFTPYILKYGTVSRSIRQRQMHGGEFRSEEEHTS